MGFVILKTVGHGVMESPHQNSKYISKFDGSREEVEKHVESLNIETFGPKETWTSWEEKYYYE